MTVLSVMRRILPLRSQSLFNSSLTNEIKHRNGFHGKMILTASRWQWHKFKDVFHFYIMLGVFPLSALVFFTNIYIGPAQLAEIPEGYIPEKWEYYKHPISRWMAKHWHPGYQEEYEKFLQTMFELDETVQMKKIDRRVKIVMKRRGDIKHPDFYGGAPDVKYLWQVRKEWDEREEYQKIPSQISMN